MEASAPQPMDEGIGSNLAVENGGAGEGPAAPAEAPGATSEPANPLLGKFNELTAAVGEKPEDFSSWTSLLSTAEKLDDIDRLRSTYDAFFVWYPLCFGYWKKYAEAERRHGNAEAATAVYERGCAATPYSTDLWVAYAAFLLATDASTDAVRSVYERSLVYIGTDFLSHKLWDKFIEFESSHGSPASVAALYSRILACPIKELDKYHADLLNHASSRTAHELLSEEATTVLKGVLEQQAADKQAAAAEAAKKAEEAAAAAATATEDKADGVSVTAAAVAAAADGEATADAEPEVAPGEEAPEKGAPSSAPVEAGDAEMTDAAPADTTAAPDQHGAAAAAAQHEAEAAAKAAADAQAAAEAAAAAVQTDEGIKALWLQQQEELYTATKAQLDARKPFETAIRRPYWHFKPLDAAQLRNWAAYLDWQEQQGDVAATVTLYERCLVPCASYPEFWQRYVVWCEEQHPEGAEQALQRATMVHCKRQPGIYVFAARFYEGRGDAAVARDHYQQLLTSVAPGLLEGVLAAANFERRSGDAAAAAAVFDQAMEQLRSKQSSDSSSSRSSDELGFVYLMYANHMRQVHDDIERARALLQQGLDACPTCKALLEGAIFFEETLPGDDRVQRVLGLYDRALTVRVSSSSSNKQDKPDGKQDAVEGTASAGVDGEDGQQDKQQQESGFTDDVMEDLSKRSVEFADMYADVATVRRLQQRHSKLFGLPPAAATAKGQAGSAAEDAAHKRPADVTAAAGAAANGPVAKQARTDAAAGAAAGATDSNAAAAAAAAAAAGYYPPPPAAGYGGYGMPPYGHPGYPPAYGHYGYGY